MGPLTDVQGLAANLAGLHDVEDAVAMHFRTASSAPGAASWNFVSSVGEDVIQIMGREGRISLSTFGNEPIRLETAAGSQEFNLPNPPHVAGPLIQTIVDDLRGQGKCESTGRSAARTSMVMDAVMKSYYGGRDDPFWQRPATWPGRRTTGGDCSTGLDYGS